MLHSRQAKARMTKVKCHKGFYMSLLFAAVTELPRSIEIGAVQGYIGLGTILLGMGIAWGTLKTSVKGIGESVKKIESKVDKIESELDGVRDVLAEHKADITGLKVHTQYGVSNSPTIPSPEGKRVLRESGFNRQYPLLQEKILALMDKRKPRTLYDYEHGAFEALGELRNDPLMDPLKDYAVNHPGESLDIIFRIASWIVRDDYARYKDELAKSP